MGLTNDSILTFISNRLLKTIDKGLGSDRLDLSASELWEINHLFNLELVQSNLQRQKPLHVGNLCFEFLFMYFGCVYFKITEYLFLIIAFNSNYEWVGKQFL